MHLPRLPSSPSSPTPAARAAPSLPVPQLPTCRAFACAAFFAYAPPSPPRRVVIRARSLSISASASTPGLRAVSSLTCITDSHSYAFCGPACFWSCSFSSCSLIDRRPALSRRALDWPHCQPYTPVCRITSCIASRISHLHTSAILVRMVYGISRLRLRCRARLPLSPPLLFRSLLLCAPSARSISLMARVVCVCRLAPLSSLSHLALAVSLHSLDR